HVDATAAVTPAARPGAHVDATAAATPAARPGAHVDATAAVTPAARPGAHVDATAAVTPAARPGAASKLHGDIGRTQGKAALIGLGGNPAIAHAAVSAAVAVQGTEMALERLIFEALRRCPAPRA